MEILSQLMAHFATLIGKPLATPGQSKPFVIKSESTKEGWQIVLTVSTGNTEKVYLSDILRVYALVVSSLHPLTQSEVDEYVKKNCVTKRTSYIIPLLGTFADIEIVEKPKLTLQYRSPNQQP